MSGDRKATEDLLSGFDRTGRTPRAPPVRPVDERRGMETVALRPPAPALWPWIAIGVVFAITMATVVFLILPEKKVVAPPLVAPLPSATASVAPVIIVDIARVVSAPVSASAPPVSRAAASASPPPPKPSDDPRVDFVRKL